MGDYILKLVKLNLKIVEFFYKIEMLIVIF